jgi:uncharacterized membrane protein YphA (DoxX/SURF4 family)
MRREELERIDLGEKPWMPAVAPVSAVGRILIALIFVRAGINKLATIAATSATMRSHGTILARYFRRTIAISA